MMITLSKKPSVRVLHSYTSKPMTNNKQNPWVQKTNSTVAGRNVYQTDSGKNVLYNKRTKTGYVIREKDEKSFRIYHNRYAMAIAVFMLFYSLFPNLLYTSIISVGFAVVLEIRYRRSFLPNLVKIENFKPRKQITLVEGIAQTHDKKKCITLTILYLALGILMVLNGYQSHHTNLFLVIDYTMLAFTLYMAIIYIKAISKMD